MVAAGAPRTAGAWAAGGRSEHERAHSVRTRGRGGSGGAPAAAGLDARGAGRARLPDGGSARPAPTGAGAGRVAGGQDDPAGVPGGLLLLLARDARILGMAEGGIRRR